MADYFKCSNCGWKGTAGEAMKPDREIEEEWKKVWELREGIQKEFGTQFYLGTLPWEKAMLEELVCPKCAGEASRVVED